MACLPRSCPPPSRPGRGAWVERSSGVGGSMAGEGCGQELEGHRAPTAAVRQIASPPSRLLQHQDGGRGECADGYPHPCQLVWRPHCAGSRTRGGPARGRQQRGAGGGAEPAGPGCGGVCCSTCCVVSAWQGDVQPTCGRGLAICKITTTDLFLTTVRGGKADAVQMHWGLRHIEYAG